MLLTSFSGITLFAALISFLAAPPPVATSLIIVDDANNRIAYTANADIGVCTCLDGDACTCRVTNCLCLLDPSYASVHEGTFYPLVAETSTNVFLTFKFTGTLVEVRYIAADIVVAGFVTNTNVRYSIDGGSAGAAVRTAQNLNAYAYNQTLFSVTGLANVEHTLRVELVPPSFLLFDYLVYEGTNTTMTPDTTNTTTPGTTNTSNPSSDEKNSTSTQLLAAILGGAGAGVVTLILGGVLVWYIRRKRRQREERKDNSKTEPDVSSPRPNSPSPNSADVPAALHQPVAMWYQPAAAPPAMPYEPPPKPFPPSAGYPQDPGWDEVNRHMSMASNQERNPPTSHE